MGGERGVWGKGRVFSLDGWFWGKGKCGGIWRAVVACGGEGEEEERQERPSLAGGCKERGRRKGEKNSPPWQVGVGRGDRKSRKEERMALLGHEERGTKSGEEEGRDECPSLAVTYEERE